MNNDHVKDEILFRCRYSETGGMSVFTINVPRWLADKLDGVEARIHCSKITLNDSRADANSITITQIPKQKSDVILQVTHHGKLQPSDNPALLDDMFIDDESEES